MFNDKGYPEKQLSEVCKKITDGTHKTPKYLGEGVTFISAKNIINGRLDFSDIKYISESEYQEIQKRCQTEKGDVLLAKSGSLGMTAIVETDESLGLFESLAILKYDRMLLNGVFLCRQMQSDAVQSQLMSNVKGVAVKHLHLNVIAKTKIIVPPMELQERFCAFARQSDKSKFAWLKSQFIEMFGDPTTNTKDLPIANLPELGENLDNKRIPITGGDRKAGKYPYYGASGIVDYVADYIFDDDLLLISEDGANLVARVTPIAFPSTGKVWINNHAHVVKFKSMAMQCYVENLLNMIDISPYVTGTAQPKLNQAKLNTIPIPVPEENMIHEYLAFVHQSDKSK